MPSSVATAARPGNPTSDKKPSVRHPDVRLEEDFRRPLSGASYPTIEQHVSRYQKRISMRARKSHRQARLQRPLQQDE